MNGRRRAHLCILVTAGIVALFAPVATAAQAANTVLHVFAGLDDGYYSNFPEGALIQATDGNFYGTAPNGGALNLGTVFQMTASGTFTILHEFAGGTDGAQPWASLIQATDGNFYGTTYNGGALNLGTVFKMTPTGTVTILHEFTSPDGVWPSASLIQTADGNFYGTTTVGGPGTTAAGTVFQITASGTFTVLHVFTGPDGAKPSASLIQATDGNFYGTTSNGGTTSDACTIRGCGTVFQMTPIGTVTTLHLFTGPDGAWPSASLIQATDGNFYGTTSNGGTSGDALVVSGDGTVFKMTPTGTFTILHMFTGGTDGAQSRASLAQATDGNFYGTTHYGGNPSDVGTVFQMTTTGTVTVLYAFSGFEGGFSGSWPSASLIQATDRNFYGTTYNGAVFEFTIAAQVTDFDGDGKADPAVYRHSNGTWYILQSGTNYTANIVVSWGASTDVPVPGDYDGDGKTDFAVYRPSTGTWYVLLSKSNYTTSLAVQWGLSTDLPQPGDYDGDGKADLTVFRPSSATWFSLLSSTNYATWAVHQFGATGDTPVPGDYDGDGKTDIAVYRSSNAMWFILNSSTNDTAYSSYQWGAAGGDLPVQGDYDGDGKADLAVYRPSTGTWYILKSSTNYTANIVVPWGASTDVPLRGDYDGDGKADPAVYRPSNGTWYILKSSTNYTTNIVVPWGASTDTPINERP